MTTDATTSDATLTIYDDVGNELHLPVPEGWSVMEALRGQRLVAGECGAQMLCATCHVYLDDTSYTTADLAPVTEDEEIMLDNLNTRRNNSRLSCQLRPLPGNSIRLQIAPAD